MVDLYKILVPIRNEAERKIQKELSGFGGIIKTPIYNSYMPVNVNFHADNQSCELSFRTGGTVQLQRNECSYPDVSIRSDCQTLQNLINNRNRWEFEQAERNGQIIITDHTQKGQTALNQIRNMFK